MYRFNRKAKQDVTKTPKPSTDGNSKNSKNSSGSSAPSSTSSVASSGGHHQKQRRPPKSESDSKSEKSLHIHRRKPVLPAAAPVPLPKPASPDKRKTMGKIVNKVVNRMPFTPNKKPQKSTPPSSEDRRKTPIKSDLRSDRVDSELEKLPKRSLSNSLSGSNETLSTDLTKGNNQNAAKMAAKMIKSDRSLIGLDGETETDYPRTGRRSSSRKRQSSDSPSSKRDKSQEENSSETKDSISLADDEEQRETYRRLFKEFAMSSQKLTLDDFKQEFSQLPGDPSSEQCSAFNLAVNSKKNRYYNIPCLESSRVRLTFMTNKTTNSSEYIHANYIKSPFLKREYILTQGPKKETIADFWRMVWQEKSTAIVMLCQFVETNREKCVEYFPRNANCSLRFDKLVLTYEDSTVNKSMVTTRLTLHFEGETRIITHFQWKEWPDYQVPGSSEVMLKILRKIRARSTPPIIHCAAGVGRSGTFVAVEIALQSINSHFKLPDIKQIVSDLRLTGRATSVQTLQQYMLIWKVLLDFGVSNKLISEESVTKFASTYRRSFRNNNLS